jgi:hypothetical protein
MGFEYYQPVNVGQGIATPVSDGTTSDIKPTPKELPVATPDTEQPTSKPEVEEKQAVEPADNKQVEDQSDVPTEQQIIDEITATRAKILEKLGIKDAPAAKQDEIMKTIDQRVAVALTKVVVEKSSPEVAAKIEQAIKNNENIEDVVAKAIREDKALSDDIEKAMKDIWDKILSESQAVKSL